MYHVCTCTCMWCCSSLHMHSVCICIHGNQQCMNLCVLNLYPSSACNQWKGVKDLHGLDAMHQVISGTVSNVHQQMTTLFQTLSMYVISFLVSVVCTHQIDIHVHIWHMISTTCCDGPNSHCLRTPTAAVQSSSCVTTASSLNPPFHIIIIMYTCT